MVVTPRKERSKDKVIPNLKQLAAIVAGIRAGGKTVAVTNGVFDILHVGHLRCLEEAKSRADFLIVVVNSDKSARAIKGEGRPFVPAAERMEMLSGLWVTDYITEFDEDTADKLLALLTPDFYAKGTDYNTRTLPEKATVKELGIKPIFVGDKKSHSTTKLADKLKGAEE